MTDDFIPGKSFHGSAEFGELFAAIWQALPDTAVYEIAGARISSIRACLNPAVITQQLGGTDG